MKTKFPKDDKIKKLDFSDEFLLDSADRRFQSGDYLGALTMLNKRNQMYQNSSDASALAADIYEAMELYPQAADAWYRFLDTCNEADFAEGYEGLAVAFMNMGCEAPSALYYHKMLEADEEIPEENKTQLLELFLQPTEKPKLRLVHSDDEADNTEAIRKGLFLLKTGNLKEAKEELSAVSQASKDYPSAVGISAMCSLMMGNTEEAEQECEALLQKYPDDIQALTTYCAVLGEREKSEEAKKIASRLIDLPAKNTDDLYKIATVLCETGLDAPAYQKLCLLKKEMPYDRSVLYFHAVACYRTGRIEEAISSLELVCTLYPRSAVAEYYLIRMRGELDGKEGNIPTSYFYKVPEKEHKTIVGFLQLADGASPERLALLGDLSQMEDFFRIAFDEKEGRDEKLQLLAARVAVKCEHDRFVREILLDYEGNELIKFSVLHALTVRNRDDSFGTVICNIYKEFFTHEIEIGERKREAFLNAFADVYSKYALLGEENENRLCYAAESIYEALEQGEAWHCMEEREALAAAIYREARLRGGERGIKRISELFDANKKVVQEILDYVL